MLLRTLVVLKETEVDFTVREMLISLVYQAASQLFVEKKYEYVHCMETGVYYLMHSDGFDTAEGVNTNDLLDHYPLIEYRLSHMTQTVMHHAELSV